MYVNTTDVSLSVAVWLSEDRYDHSNDPKEISATALLKPIRQIVLGARVEPSDGIADVINNFDSGMGTAVHDAIETAWVENYETNMAKLGYPKRVIDKIWLNPPRGADLTDRIPVYMEQRLKRRFGDFMITGKFDFIMDGQLEDFKTTKTYAYTKQTNDDNYRLQGSIYRWLDPVLITKNDIHIQYLFKDWSPAGLQRNPKYPKNKVVTKKIPLLDLASTEAYIRTKLDQVIRLKDANQNELPLCTQQELWQDASVFKYYKNPAKTSRSTANFDTYAEASLRHTKDGGCGLIKEFKGKAKACLYCRAVTICDQAKNLVAQDLLDATAIA